MTEDDRSDEPYFPVTCQECGTEWHAGDSGPCPSCGASSMSYSFQDAREYTDWQRQRGVA